MTRTCRSLGGYTLRVKNVTNREPALPARGAEKTCKMGFFESRDPASLRRAFCNARLQKSLHVENAI
jgi:hypothetical protein